MVPVRSATRDYGYLVAAYSEPGRFLAQERQPVEVYARYAAVALDSAAARLEAERRSRESGSLLAFSREISVAGTSQEITARVAESVPLVVDSDAVGVYLWDGHVLTGVAINRLESGPATHDPLMPRSWKPLPGGSLERFISEPDLDPVFLNLAGGGTPKDPETLRMLGISAAILVPLASRHELLGAVVVMARDRPERLRWSPALSARIAGIAAQATVALENGRLMDVVTHQATHDRLTGLPNRAQFGADLDAAVISAAREHRLAAVFYMDLDQFKSVNDRFGHEVGDELLTAVAGRLRGCTRPQDTAARLGGDEFALVVTAESIENLDDVGERIAVAFGSPFQVLGVSDRHRQREEHPGARVGEQDDSPDERVAAQQGPELWVAAAQPLPDLGAAALAVGDEVLEPGLEQRCPVQRQRAEGPQRDHAGDRRLTREQQARVAAGQADGDAGEVHRQHQRRQRLQRVLADRDDDRADRGQDACAGHRGHERPPECVVEHVVDTEWDDDVEQDRRDR
jgi:GGDEF domain-containing protein